jgi:hypothetical protein
MNRDYRLEHVQSFRFAHQYFHALPAIAFLAPAPTLSTTKPSKIYIVTTTYSSSKVACLIEDTEASDMSKEEVLTVTQQLDEECVRFSKKIFPALRYVEVRLRNSDNFWILFTVD